MVHVEVTPTEIAAAPERVREVLLDFAKMPEWHQEHFKSIKVPSGKNPKDLVKGDKLEVALTHGMKFSPAILENTPARLKWRGSLPGIFTGDHVFEFQASEVNPGGTRFVQYEDFSGLLSFTMKPEKKSGASNLEGFTTFNNDLKKRVESGV